MAFIGTNRNDLEPLTVTHEDLAVAESMRLFVEMLPLSEVPEEGQFHRWFIKGAGKSALFRAITRAGRKFKAQAECGREMGPEDIAKYITSIAVRESTGQRIVPPNKNKNLNRVGIRRL
jgi:hypothetical protein